MYGPNKTEYLSEPIDDVGKTTKSLMFRKYKIITIAWISISAAWLLFIEILLANLKPKLSESIPFLVSLIPLMGFGLWWLYLRQKIHGEFMAQFARQNGFTYAKNGILETKQGLIFSFGDSHKIINEITGTIEGYPIKLYNLEITTRRGKNTYTDLFTVFEMTAVNNIPQLFLNSKKAPFMSQAGNPVWLSKSNILKLEGDFNNYFDLYVPEQYEQEALQIFTPQIMAEMVDTAQNYDMEIIDRQVRIITMNYIENTKTLNEMHDHAKRVLKLFEKTLSKFSYQPIGDYAPHLKNKSFFGLSKRTKQIISISYPVLFIGLLIYLYIFHRSLFSP